MQIPKANFIDGKWMGEGKSTLVVKNKYTAQEMTLIPNANQKQIELAIESANKAFETYKYTSAEDRKQLLLELADSLKQKKDFFSDLISQEAGKPISYAKAELERCITTLEATAERCLTFSGEMVPMDYGLGKGKTAYTKRYPIGPIIAIAPFNFPLNLALHKIAPALAVGCSIVIKPSPYTPLSLLAFAKLFEEVKGLKGLLNVVNCDVEEAELLVRNESFKMLSFTGSPQVGWHLKNIAGKKKVALELGGNAGVYVDHDSDMDTVAKQCAIGAFLYSGQICISTQRLFVHEAIYDEFVQKLKVETEQLKVGKLDNEETLVSSLIDKVHLERIDAWVREAVEEGANLDLGGKIISEDHNLYAPTILSNVKDHSKVNCEEVFGPVVIVEKVKDYQEGVKRLNDSKFGLQAGVFVKDIEKIKWISDHLEVGGIIFNNIPGFRVDTMPYGGVKDSGFGREGMQYAMEEMTEPRLIVY